MKYQPDNLSPKKKKNALISIFLLTILITSFVIYKNTKGTEREQLLANNTKLTICKIIQTSTYKGITNTVEYNVSGKKYTYQGLSYKGFLIGELYRLKYSIVNPEISEVIYSKPVIDNINDYKESKGKIISLYSNSKVNIIKLQYDYREKKYERSLYVNNISEYEKNIEYTILINKKKPKISYLKSTVEILN
jgi:hypothetical protein